MIFRLYVGNDNLVELDELKDESDGSYVNDATVTLTDLEDKDGTSVTGQSFPTSMAYVAASNGKYQGTLEDGLAVTAGEKYFATIDVDAGSDKIAQWTLECRAMTRGS